MIVVHPRASAVRGEWAMVVALTALLVIVSLAPRGGAAAAGLAAVALTLLAWHRRASAATSLGFLFASCLVVGVVGLGPQQIVFALAFATYAVVFTRVAWLRGATGWLRLGARNGTLREGFPRGAVGVGLAFVYGAVLGALRREAGGLFIPWVTHVLTDLVIVSVVLALPRS